MECQECFIKKVFEFNEMASENSDIVKKYLSKIFKYHFSKKKIRMNWTIKKALRWAREQSENESRVFLTTRYFLFNNQFELSCQNCEVISNDCRRSKEKGYRNL